MPFRDTQIRAMREAGAVLRCHATPHLGHYDVAQHCYNMAAMYMVLCEDPQAHIYKAILLHDFAERWVGDVPATAKWKSPKLAYEVDLLEEITGAIYGLAKVELTPEEYGWVKGLDIVELMLWCEDQMGLGNRHNVRQIYQKCHVVFDRDQEDYPAEIRSWYRIRNERTGWSPQRLEDEPWTNED